MFQTKALRVTGTDGPANTNQIRDAAEVIPFPRPCDRNTHILATRKQPVSDLLSEWIARWRARRQLARELLPAPDEVLADAGFTRQRLGAEIAKPFWQA
jgi:uncharacterized protein YjiS (DUF1127 family)